jgi:uncharacterized membrane protein YqjE
MSGPTEAPSGLLAALQTVAGSLLAMGQTRLELLANEVEVQKLQALRMLLLAGALLFCAGLGIVLLVVLLALAAGEFRLLVVGCCAVAFLLTAVFLYRALMRATRAPEPAFDATLAELQEDIRSLKAASGHAKAPD